MSISDILMGILALLMVIGYFIVRFLWIIVIVLVIMWAISFGYHAFF